jgi:aspartate carbamoyltransferase catalytic subunit
MTPLRHVLSVGQFDRPMVERLFAGADEMRVIAQRGGDHRLAGRLLATLFFEPSTRTRLSFEAAMLRLGGQVISAEMASDTTSATKGETIEDTTRIVQSYADAIVMRHPAAGAADRAAGVAEVPIINAGDGAREHPTQALLDLYTIRTELGRVDNLTVALVGDLRYGRAARSLALLLARMDSVRLLLATPPGIAMSDDVVNRLKQARVAVEQTTSLDEVVGEAQVIYMTRVQKERFPDEATYQAVAGRYQLTAAHLQRMRPDAIVMHPLPRVDELSTGVDADPRAAYFRQVKNGLYLRMALLDWLFGGSAGGQ